VKQLKIQWQIGNQCNFRCGYCHHDYHDGSNPMLSYEQLDSALENIRQSTQGYDDITMEFLGGEPTISRSVRNALAYPADKRFRYNITSNGSADLDWWSKAAPNLDIIMLAWHYLADEAHFKSVVEQLSKTHDREHLVITVNADPNFWDRAQEMYEWLNSNGYNGKIKILFSNHNKGNDRFYRSYSTDQMLFYCKENGIGIPTDPTKYSVASIEAKLYTDYKTHLCWAGVDQIVIDYFGYVYRGWCMVGSGYGNVFEGPIKLDTNPRVCTRVLCKNGFDQGAKKSEKGWGL
jgi:sulfatase maturation enzyme AslB (radical SAM superfamily)